MSNIEFGQGLNFKPEGSSQSNQERVLDRELHPVFTQERFFTGVKLDRKYPLTSVIEKKVAESPRNMIPWSEYMDTLMFHPKHGYYINTEIGKNFYTSPEWLDSFGEHIGQQVFNVWSAMGAPSRFQIREMGPGNGTLALSLLKWSKAKQPDFYSAIQQYKMIERSSGLIEKQQKKIGAFDVIHKVKWVEESAIDSEMSDIEGVIISNEVPDAFAVERVTRLNGRVVQKYVGVENDEWVEVWGDPSSDVEEYIEENGYEIREGIEVPINLAAVVWKKKIASLKKGAILTIDYGKWGQVGRENCVSIKNYGEVNGVCVKEYDDMFASYKAPGMIDITTDVDFGVLKRIAGKHGLDIAFSGEQSEFLLRNGLGEEIQKLGEDWKRTGSLYDGIPHQMAVMATNTEGLCVLLATKGIDSGRIMGEKSIDEFKYPVVEIPLPYSTRKIESVKKLEHGEGTRVIQQDCSPLNPLIIGPDGFKGTVIYDVSGEEKIKLFDFGDDLEKIDEFILFQGWRKGITSLV